MNRNISGRDVRHHLVKFSQNPSKALVYWIIQRIVSLTAVTSVDLVSIDALAI